MTKRTNILIAIIFFAAFISIAAYSPITSMFKHTYYVDATEADHGAAGNGGGAYDIVTALGASKQITLVFDMTDTSNNNTDYVFSTSLTFTSNYTLDIRSGARLDPDSAKTVTVHSPAHLIC